MERGANTFPFHNLLPYSESSEGLFLYFLPSLNWIKIKVGGDSCYPHICDTKTKKSVHRITRGIPSEFSTWFPYEVSPAKFNLLPTESPSERIITTLFLVFSKTSFRQESSQQFLLAANSAFCSLSCSQKTTSNFWCVYFPQ